MVNIECLFGHIVYTTREVIHVCRLINRTLIKLIPLVLVLQHGMPI